MNIKVLLPVVAVAAAVAAFWFLVLAPKREEITRLDAEISKQESAAEQAEQLAASYERAKANYRTNYTTIARLGKAVPADDDIRSLLVQLDETARKAKVNFRALSLAGDGSQGGGEDADAAATPGELAPAPGSVPVGSAGFAAMPFSFSFSGSFFTLSDFFQRLERFVTVQNDQIDVTGRLLLLGSIAVTPDAGDLTKLQAQIGAATYIVPPTQGVTGGATPQAPAAVTPAATAPDDGATASNPSATITGVR